MHITRFYLQSISVCCAAIDIPGNVLSGHTQLPHDGDRCRLQRLGSMASLRRCCRTIIRPRHGAHPSLDISRSLPLSIRALASHAASLRNLSEELHSRHSCMLVHQHGNTHILIIYISIAYVLKAHTHTHTLSLSLSLSWRFDCLWPGHSVIQFTHRFSSTCCKS